jgi:hypothetical protein
VITERKRRAKKARRFACEFPAPAVASACQIPIVSVAWRVSIRTRDKDGLSAGNEHSGVL